MRIASVAKAFNGAVALHLVSEGRLGLDDTIGQRLGGMPAAWASVTVRQMLNHTSGLPDYTQSKGFAEQAKKDPARLRLSAEDHRLGARANRSSSRPVPATSTRTRTTSWSA